MSILNSVVSYVFVSSCSKHEEQEYRASFYDVSSLGGHYINDCGDTLRIPKMTKKEYVKYSILSHMTQDVEFVGSAYRATVAEYDEEISEVGHEFGQYELEGGAPMGLYHYLNNLVSSRAAKFGV